MKWIWTVLLVSLAAVGLSIALNPPMTIDVWWWRRQLILLTGVAAFAMMSLIMLLAVRPVWLEKTFGGLDKMYRVHKWAGILAISLGLLHYFIDLSGPHLLIQWFERPARGSGGATTFLSSFKGIAKELGEWSVWLLGATLLITLWQRVPYRPWRYLHKAMAVVYLLLAFHTLVLAPTSYWTQPVGWILAACIAVGSVCAIISLTGNIGRTRRHRGVVTGMRTLSDGMFEITCKLQGAWRHRAGQFAFLRTEKPTLEGQHPFTISSADQGNNEIRFSIKALGDYTRKLQHALQPGAKVEVEGPYGQFDFQRNTQQQPQIWIAGGIGVTPFLAWLHRLNEQPELCPDVDLHYCVRNAEQAIYADELNRLSANLPRIRLHLHYSEKSGNPSSESLQIKPKHDQWPTVWFCGPSTLSEKLRKELDDAGMPLNLFHQEAFQMR
ncbi:MAG: ferric reductase-like transmembrane domain-containing protein [Xanthomonadaceae bacterium]|nr:ferric reductase-like transmembrane domain-containing protein [Xanthomonadaceae bacterium]